MIYLKTNNETIGYCKEISVSKNRTYQDIYSVGIENPVDRIFGRHNGYDIFIPFLYLESESYHSQFAIIKYYNKDYRKFANIFFFCKIEDSYKSEMSHGNYCLFNNAKIYAGDYIQKEIFTPDELMIKDIIE